jgi:hypothetical protein
LNAGAGVGRLGLFREGDGVFVMAKKKSARKKVATSSLTAKLEKTIEKDFQACEELQRTGKGRNEWIERRNAIRSIR